MVVNSNQIKIFKYDKEVRDCYKCESGNIKCESAGLKEGLVPWPL